MATSNNSPCPFVWSDGKVVPYAEAAVPLLSHSLHYGTAAFEGMRAYETKKGQCAIFRAKEHFERLLHSIHALGFDTPYTVDDYLKGTVDCLKKNKLLEGYIRPICFVDDTHLGLGMPKKVSMHSAIAVWPWGKYMGEGREKGIRTMISSYRRPDISTALPQAKLSGNYLNSSLSRREANLHGYDEAILLDLQGFIAEGPGENLFVVSQNKLFTPYSAGILPGITRDSVFSISRELNYEISERPLTRNELYNADELFFVGTAVEVTPIIEVDDRRIGSGKPGPITQSIAELYFKAVRADAPAFNHWLTLIQ